MREVRSEMSLVKDGIKDGMGKFTTDVVECLSNNFDGFSAKLEGKPCKQHTNAIEDLRKKYIDHEGRISELEKEVQKLKT